MTGFPPYMPLACRALQRDISGRTWAWYGRIRHWTEMIERGLTAVFVRTGLVASLVGLALAVRRIESMRDRAHLWNHPQGHWKSAAVFAGRVDYIDEDDVGQYPVTIEFDVSTVWKGPDHQTMYLMTSRDRGLCGYGFALDLEYLVYSQDGVRVSACSRTRKLVGASTSQNWALDGLLRRVASDRGPVPLSTARAADVVWLHPRPMCPLSR